MKETIQRVMDIIEGANVGMEQHRCLEEGIPPLIAFYASFGPVGVKIAHRFLKTLRRDIRALPEYSLQESSLRFLDQCSKFLLRNPEIQRPEIGKR